MIASCISYVSRFLTDFKETLSLILFTTITGIQSRTTLLTFILASLALNKKEMIFNGVFKGHH
jgi:hypothetical protein